MHARSTLLASDGLPFSVQIFAWAWAHFEERMLQSAADHIPTQVDSR